MSANTIWRSAPVSVLTAFALGAAAAAGCGAALAALMASRGMSPGTAWPFATASVCVGSLLGVLLSVPTAPTPYTLLRRHVRSRLDGPGGQA